MFHEAFSTIQTSNVASAPVVSSRGSGVEMGGYYMLSAIITGGSSPSVEVQMLGPDGSTYQSLPTAMKLTASGTIYGYLPPGTYQWTIAGSPTAVKAALSRMPLA